jgi:hypothetical protein
VQQFPIVVDMILPDDVYTLTPLARYSGISPDHGEDEFIISDLTVISSTIQAGAGGDRQIARLTYSLEGSRHLNYYILQVFVPILLIILISWFTFFSQGLWAAYRGGGGQRSAPYRLPLQPGEQLFAVGLHHLSRCGDGGHVCRQYPGAAVQRAVEAHGE